MPDEALRVILCLSARLTANTSRKAERKSNMEKYIEQHLTEQNYNGNKKEENLPFGTPNQGGAIQPSGNPASAAAYENRENPDDSHKDK